MLYHPQAKNWPSDKLQIARGANRVSCSEQACVTRCLTRKDARPGAVLGREHRSSIVNITSLLSRGLIQSSERSPTPRRPVKRRYLGLFADGRFAGALTDVFAREGGLWRAHVTTTTNLK